MNKRKTPRGDGNSRSLSDVAYISKYYEQKKTPRGDGNFISPISFCVNWVCIMKKRETKKGDGNAYIFYILNSVTFFR